MIRDFFRDVYNSLKAIGGVNITPEVDAFFREISGLNAEQRGGCAEIKPELLNRTDKSKYMTDEEASRAKQDYKVFAQKFMDFLSGKMTVKEVFTLSNRLPSAYDHIPQLKGKRMVMSQNVLKKIIDLPNKWNKNHNLDYKRAEKLPLYITDPLYIVQSKSKGNEDRFIIVTNSKGEGKSVRLSVIVQPDNNAVVVSAYDERINISKEKKAGRVKYKKKEELAKLPYANHIVIANSINNITDKEQLVNRNNQETLYQLPVKAYDKNGKADINTPEFKKWFADSKVLDESGKPLAVYHGDKWGKFHPGITEFLTENVGSFFFKQ